MTTLEMEVILMGWLKYASNTVVPNVSWGLGLHECDLLRVTPSGYATEVEIKVTKSDLLKDKEKDHGHYSPKIKALYFAVPEKLEDVALEEIPKRAGLLVVRKNEVSVWVDVVKKPKQNMNSHKWSEKEINQLQRLGCLRISTLKNQLLRSIK